MELAFAVYFVINSTLKGRKEKIGEALSHNMRGTVRGCHQ